ncbi:hypothetical protein FQA39_LY00415 [Lamprigera yunnana]|nr:hypothetical protein FQA39_LY00415 [Lamprigera yunnana]
MSTSPRFYVGVMKMAPGQELRSPRPKRVGLRSRWMLDKVVAPRLRRKINIRVAARVGFVMFINRKMARVGRFFKPKVNRNDIAFKRPCYSYSEPNGPSCWKTLFPDSTGTHQSPINISLSNTIAVPAENETLLCFSEGYNITPNEMTIYNDGYCVTLYARWDDDYRPQVTGGACRNTYEFLNARFRWGLNDQEGSEHTIDFESYAMELQAIHIKVGKRYANLNQAALENSLLIISYLYEVSPIENVYLKTLISSLPKIQNPHVCDNIEPIPLSYIMPSFVCKYASYSGSLTFPPCTEGVQWIVQTEPLGIASNQVAQFRQLRTHCGNLELNKRPVQNTNCRDIMFYD